MPATHHVQGETHVGFETRRYYRPDKRRTACKLCQATPGTTCNRRTRLPQMTPLPHPTQPSSRASAKTCETATTDTAAMRRRVDMQQQEEGKRQHEARSLSFEGNRITHAITCSWRNAPEGSGPCCRTADGVSSPQQATQVVQAIPVEEWSTKHGQSVKTARNSW